MEALPIYVSLIFALTTVFTVILFCKAIIKPIVAYVVILVWLLLHAVLSFNGFYLVTATIPPRFVLAVLPAILTVILFFISKKGRQFIDAANPATLTLLHIVRIPVELVLYWLFLYKLVPEVMTFEGRNMDILSGISAPFIYYFGYVRKRLSKGFLLIWNFACLGLLFNIVIHAVLAAPFPFQQIAFDQPNVAVLYFPFIWLPCCVVPLVLFSHLICIRQLLNK